MNSTLSLLVVTIATTMNITTDDVMVNKTTTKMVSEASSISNASGANKFMDKTTEMSANVTLTTGYLNNTDSPEKYDHEESITITSYYIGVIVSPIIIITGVTGNILAICVLTRPELIKTPSNYFLIALAFADMGRILIAADLPYFLKEAIKFDYGLQGTWACRLRTFFYYYWCQLCGWFLAMLTIWRFRCVYFPLSARANKNKMLCVALIFTTIIAIGLIDMPFFWAVEQTYKDGQPQCKAVNDQYETYKHNINPWIDLVIACLLPAVIIFSGNMAIIGKLLKFRSKRMNMKQGQERDDDDSKALLIILILLSVAYFLLTFPLQVYLIAEPLVRDTLFAGPKGHELSMNLWYASEELYSLNSVINFYFYVVGGGKFREQLKIMICCGKYKGKSGGEMKILTSDTTNAGASNDNLANGSNIWTVNRSPSNTV
ncbi:unnamed protein product [Owenia fusiformis]|uniref:Uncharacterized protein n=1 Tax=Owenia fusiformis TaxID=6347 RepID=A0A8J1U8C8_OWEFU|nr:unnamed protein product [Owenia fusiformis]